MCSEHFNGFSSAGMNYFAFRAFTRFVHSNMLRNAILSLLCLAATLGKVGSQRSAMYERASTYNIESPCKSGWTKVQVDFQSGHLRSGRSSSVMEVLQFTLQLRDEKLGDKVIFERQTVEDPETFALCLQPRNSFWLTLHSYIPASLDMQARGGGASTAVTGAVLCNKHKLTLDEKFALTASVLDGCTHSNNPGIPNSIEMKTATSTSHYTDRALSFLKVLDVNDPTVSPSLVPSPFPTRKPTKPRPTAEPSDPPTSIPTSIPTSYPTAYPTPPPTSIPTSIPTSYPSPEPTSVPTATPTFGCNPSNKPTDEPSSQPSAAPTSPTSLPTSQPSVPSSVPTAGPSIPTFAPSLTPSATPSVSAAPTVNPTTQPSAEPTARPTLSSAPISSVSPSVEPTAAPTIVPTITLTGPTFHPTIEEIEEIPRPTNEGPGAGTPQDAGSKRIFVETDTGIGTLAGAGFVVLAIVAIVVFYCVRASRNLVKVPQAPPDLAMRI